MFYVDFVTFYVDFVMFCVDFVMFYVDFVMPKLIVLLVERSKNDHAR